MEEYNLREKQSADTKSLIRELQESSSKICESYNFRDNIDNCSCPECPCCDPDMKWLWPIGAGVLAATTPILAAAYNG